MRSTPVFVLHLCCLLQNAGILRSPRHAIALPHTVRRPRTRAVPPSYDRSATLITYASETSAHPGYAATRTVPVRRELLTNDRLLSWQACLPINQGV